ncbi:MAG TPA: hypothetical protein VIK18_01330 [Pirellulales bacterium]
MSEHPQTRELTLFSVIDAIRAKQVGPNAIADEAFRFKIVSNWMREDGDEDVEFEHEFAAVSPDGHESISAGTTGLRFDPRLRFQRFIVESKGIPVIRSSGWLWIVSRLRKVGSSDWLVQRCPIFVSLFQPVTAAATTIQKGDPD